MSRVLKGHTLISTKQRTKGSWCKLLYYEGVVLWAVSCRHTRWYLRNGGRWLPDARCYIMKELFYELCPAGTHADIYETEGGGFLMPKLLYFEGVVLWALSCRDSRWYLRNRERRVPDASCFILCCLKSCVLQGRRLIFTKPRTEASLCQLQYFEGFILWAMSCRDAHWYLRNREWRILMPDVILWRSRFLSCVLQGRMLIFTKQRTEGSWC